MGKTLTHFLRNPDYGRATSCRRNLRFANDAGGMAAQIDARVIPGDGLEQDTGTLGYVRDATMGTILETRRRMSRCVCKE